MINDKGENDNEITKVCANIRDGIIREMIVERGTFCV